MKTFFFAAAIFGSMTLLHAAEAVPFAFRMNGTTEAIRSEAPVTPQKSITAVRNENNKWGMSLTVSPKKTEPNTMYRIRFDVKGAPFAAVKLGKSAGRCAVGKGIVTLYHVSDSSEPERWQFNFAKSVEKIEISHLSVDKISPEEYCSNLLVDEALEPGFWHGIWGKRDGCFPKLVEEENSPNGKLLHFDATKPGDGHKASMLLPFLPDRKYEISFWIRSDTPDLILWQVAYGGIKHTRLRIGREWTEVRMSGTTPEKEPKGGMFLMFFRSKQPLPEFEIGGVDFHYLK